MILARFCSCGLTHHYLCPIPVIHEIKERVCRARGIVSYIPEGVCEKIDRLVEEEMARRRARMSRE